MNLERQVYTILEVSKILGISRNSAYLAAEKGDIASTRIGGRILVSKAEVERILAPKPEAQRAA